MERSIDLTRKALRTRSTNSYKGMTKLCHVSALCTITSYNNAHDAIVCEQKMFPKKLGCGRCSQIGQQLMKSVRPLHFVAYWQYLAIPARDAK